MLVDFLRQVPYFDSVLSTHHSSLIPSFRGAVAQLGERLNGIQEVVGSIPISSTILDPSFFVSQKKGNGMPFPFFVARVAFSSKLGPD